MPSSLVTGSGKQHPRDMYLPIRSADYTAKKDITLGMPITENAVVLICTDTTDYLFR